MYSHALGQAHSALRLGHSNYDRMKDAQLCISVFSPEFPPNKKEEQMENSSPSHGYFPAGKFRYPASRRRAPALRSSKHSLLTLFFHLRHPHCSATCPNIFTGRTPKRKMSFPFLEKIGRAQIRKARNIFLWGCRAERGIGGTIRAYDLVSSHHALRACDIICSGGRERTRTSTPYGTSS